MRVKATGVATDRLGRGEKRNRRAVPGTEIWESRKRALQIGAVRLDPGIEKEKARGGNEVGSQAQTAKLSLEVEALRRNEVRLHQEAYGYQQPYDTQPKQESLNHRSQRLDWRLPAAFREMQYTVLPLGCSRDSACLPLGSFRVVRFA